MSIPPTSPDNYSLNSQGTMEPHGAAPGPIRRRLRSPAATARHFPQNHANNLLGGDLLATVSAMARRVISRRNSPPASSPKGGQAGDQGLEAKQDALPSQQPSQVASNRTKTLPKGQCVPVVVPESGGGSLQCQVKLHHLCCRKLQAGGIQVAEVGYSRTPGGPRIAGAAGSGTPPLGD